MNKLLENTLGVINDGDSWIEVRLEDTPPKKSISGIGKGYVYITKYYRDRSIGDHSIGLPADKAIELGTILLGNAR
jgi:hypothetical protein